MVDGVILKAHLHGIRALECQYLGKFGLKIQDYVISCNNNITSFVLSITDYIPGACVTASLRGMNLNSTTSMQMRL